VSPYLIPPVRLQKSLFLETTPWEYDNFFSVLGKGEGPFLVIREVDDYLFFSSSLEGSLFLCELLDFLRVRAPIFFFYLLSPANNSPFFLFPPDGAGVRRKCSTASVLAKIVPFPFF